MARYPRVALYKSRHAGSIRLVGAFGSAMPIEPRHSWEDPWRE